MTSRLWLAAALLAAAVSAQHSREASIAGVTRTVDGEVWPGATIVLWPADSPSSWRQIESRTLQSDIRGRFRVTLPRFHRYVVYATSEPNGEGMVRRSSARMVVAPGIVSLQEDSAQPTSVRVTLDGVAVRARIMGLPRARVAEPLLSSFPVFRPCAPLRWEGTARADGSFDVPCLPSGGYLAFEDSVGRLVLRSRWDPAARLPSGGNEVCEGVLNPGRPTAVRVEREGEPVVGARIAVPSAAGWRILAETGETGRAEFDLSWQRASVPALGGVAPPGPVVVLPGGGAAVAGLRLGPGTTGPMVCSLAAAELWSFRVHLDDQLLDGSMYAQGVLSSAEGGRSSRLRIPWAGELPNPAILPVEASPDRERGLLQVCLELPDSLRGTVDPRVTVPVGGAESLDLNAATKLRLTVQDSRGLPASGAQVWICPRDDYRLLRWLTPSRTGDDGVSCTLLPHDEEILVVIQHERGVLILERSPDTGQEAEATVRLRPWVEFHVYGQAHTHGNYAVELDFLEEATPARFGAGLLDVVDPEVVRSLVEGGFRSLRDCPECDSASREPNRLVLLPPVAHLAELAVRGAIRTEGFERFEPGDVRVLGR